MYTLTAEFDVAIIGGGINGCGIARDAQGRGLRTLLVEQHDLAAHTSSASTKLIHGGLRYLEQYEFSLVRKALKEREILLAAAPHITHPMRFVMPHDPGMRPAWLIRTGMWLYDHLAHRNTLPASTHIDLRRHPAGKPLRAAFKAGFEYSDGWVDDARLVVLNAMDAGWRGATILTRHKAERARRYADRWELDLVDAQGRERTVSARILVNASGPWAGSFLHQTLGIKTSHDVRLVKGSHIIVPQCFDHQYAYIFQNPDKRIVFAIPYQGRYTLIGTTDIEYHGDPAQVSISEDETAYLCDVAQRYFAQSLRPQDVVSSYSGVRPLLQEEGKTASEVTRDYWLDLDTSAAPVLSIFGGKITTYRLLAQEVLQRLEPALGAHAPPWTAHAPLPGGDLPQGSLEAYQAVLSTRYPGMPHPLLDRYAHAYGTLSTRILGHAATPADLGREIAPDVFEAELRYLHDQEWARTGEDVLWRRSKLGLHLAPAQCAAVAQWMQGYAAESQAMADRP